MAQGDTNITVVGNAVADPELRFTPSGAAVANFRIASTPRRYNAQTQQWEDGEALFLTCNAWRNMAENVAESVSKGMRVIVTGRLRQRSFQTKEGESRTVFEIEVDEVGPSLKYASAQVNRNPREGGSGNFGGGGTRVVSAEVLLPVVRRVDSVVTSPTSRTTTVRIMIRGIPPHPLVDSAETANLHFKI